MTSSAKPGRHDSDEKNAPVFSRRVWTGSGNVECAVFPKEIEGENGPYVVFNTIAKRSWKEDGEWKSGNAFRPEDLLPLALFLQEAASFVMQQSKR